MMKLYVWDHVFCDYTCGVAFALAESVEHARELVKAECYDDEDVDVEPLVYDLNEPMCRAVWGGG